MCLETSPINVGPEWRMNNMESVFEIIKYILHWLELQHDKMTIAKSIRKWEEAQRQAEIWGMFSYAARAHVKCEMLWEEYDKLTERTG